MAPTRKKTVVIDDEELMTDLCKVYPEAKQFEVHTAADAMEGVGLAGSNAVDVVITDMWMRGCTDCDAIRELRKVGLDTPVILVSGEIAGEKQREVI